MTEQTYRIKPLEFKRVKGANIPLYVAKTPLGCFVIQGCNWNSEWMWYRTQDPNVRCVFSLVERGKWVGRKSTAVRQANRRFRKLLLPALEPTPKETN